MYGAACQGEACKGLGGKGSGYGGCRCKVPEILFGIIIKWSLQW